MSRGTIPPEKASLRHRWFSFLGRSEIPVAVYIAIFSTMTFLWVIQEVHEDLTLGLFTELLGAAFTLFIIDTLLVRAKDKRWKVVRNHVDYLIGRNVNRLRDGIATRVFAFNPRLEQTLSGSERVAAMRHHRAGLLEEVEGLDAEALGGRLGDSSLFDEDTDAWFNEKADDLWEIINMKYSEYLDPALVSLLIRLHTQMKDVCAHIRQYRKAEKFPESQAHYHEIGRLGVSVSLREVITLSNELKRKGYSEMASLVMRDEAEPTAV